MWLRMRCNVFFQRINYLFKGNAQGVSIGFLGKSGSTILPMIEDLVSIFPLITQSNLRKGAELYGQVVQRQSGSLFPANYDSGATLGAFLYAYIKAYRPRIIVETGVANGITTNMIMEALEEGSVLHSFDVDGRTRVSYVGNKKWEFHLLESPFHKSLKSMVDNLEPVDLWLHDSNHGGVWQSYEYALALKKISPKGVLVSDDVDASTAWASFVKNKSGNSYIVHDLRKVIGIYLAK